jgi:hypothetical protein
MHKISYWMAGVLFFSLAIGQPLIRTGFLCVILRRQTFRLYFYDYLCTYEVLYLPWKLRSIHIRIQLLPAVCLVVYCMYCTYMSSQSCHVIGSGYLTFEVYSTTYVYCCKACIFWAGYTISSWGHGAMQQATIWKMGNGKHGMCLQQSYTFNGL